MVRKITIVSLSKGILGEAFIKHELEIGVRRLQNYGIQVQFASNALKGMEFLQDHPEARAADLLEALRDQETDLILCAVGGDDTYRLLPYLFEQDELKEAVKGNQKIFLGFSDTTMNHFMLHKVGMKTFYGQAFLPDVCELDHEMFPYTRHYFEELLQSGRIAKVTPSEVWYDAREDFSEEAIGFRPPEHNNQGFELLQGSPMFTGEILGGCIDTIYDMFYNERYEDSVELCKKYELFPSVKEWVGKILLLESSEECATPQKYKRALQALKETGIFGVIHGILVGKPVNEIYEDEYKKALVEVIDDSSLSVVCNANIGHATPRCILPFGVMATVDVTKQEIVLKFPKN